MMLKKLLLAVLVLILSVPVIAYAQDEEEAPETTLFIGTVTDEPDLFVGLAVIGEDVTLYICDGQADKGTISIAQWFMGALDDDTIDITAPNDNRVEVTVDEDSATGHFTFADGTVKEFALHLAEDEAALYRSEFNYGDEEFVLGWLILEDGTQRGGGVNKRDGSVYPATFNPFIKESGRNDAPNV